MTQYAKVVALTVNPSFYDMYGTQGPIGGTYNPSVGDEGYMELGAAQTAQTAGDVLIHVQNTAVAVDNARRGEGAPAALTAGVGVVAGTPDTPVDVTIGGGPADKVYSFEVTCAVDGGDAVVQTEYTQRGATAAAAAADIAVSMNIPNVTAEASGAVVTFTPDIGMAITTLTVTVT